MIEDKGIRGSRIILIVLIALSLSIYFAAGVTRRSPQMRWSFTSEQQQSDRRRLASKQNLQYPGDGQYRVQPPAVRDDFLDIVAPLHRRRPPLDFNEPIDYDISDILSWQNEEQDYLEDSNRNTKLQYRHPTLEDSKRNTKLQYRHPTLEDLKGNPKLQYNHPTVTVGRASYHSTKSRESRAKSKISTKSRHIDNDDVGLVGTPVTSSGDQWMYDVPLDSEGNFRLRWSIYPSSQIINFRLEANVEKIDLVAFGFSSYGEATDADFVIFWTDYYGRHLFQVFIQYIYECSSLHFKPN